jgi:hypothetical protein
MKKVHDGTRNPTVREIFQAHTGRQIDKWDHYMEIYEKHFAKYVGKTVRVLEIGVDHGGSLQMWKEYFGPAAMIVGVDLNPICKEYEEDQIDICIRDQCDASLAQLGPFDIVIDDGSHVCAHQSITFRHLWPETRGVYLIEDCHGGYPLLEPHIQTTTRYPWVVVVERPRRIIRGTPSHKLRDDELKAWEQYGQYGT